MAAALSGVKIVCVGQFYLAPYASMILARMGAEVIKVEALTGDPYRRGTRPGEEEISVQFGMINSGKRSLALDLRHPEGQEILRKLVLQADVLVQNLSPGGMDRLGLGYEDLAQINPRLIMASGSGFGSSGPLAGKPAMDLTIQARTALMTTTGFPENPPVRTGPSIVDFMGGIHLAAGILGALYQREHTGRGQHVEVSLQDAIMPSLSSNIAGMVSSGGTMPERTGNRHGGLAVVPYNAFPAKDGWVTLLCPTQPHWERLCDIMGRPDLKETYPTMRVRCENYEEVDAIVGAWTAGYTREEIAEMTEPAKIPTAPVVTLPELIADEHTKARGVLRWEKDDDGDFLTWGSPIFMSDSPVEDPPRTRPLGADTDEILTLLGFTDEQIAALHAQKTVG